MGWCDTMDGCLNGKPKSEATNYCIVILTESPAFLPIYTVEQIVETAQPHGWSKCSVHGTKRIKEVIYG